MKSLEIFSGAGGLAKGLELAGFQHSAFVEFNKHACASLNENFDAEKVFFGDIKDFDFGTLQDVDVVAGGPPCQPFSLGGKHGADQDSRDMFPYAIRAIEKSPQKLLYSRTSKACSEHPLRTILNTSSCGSPIPDLSPGRGRTGRIICTTCAASANSPMRGQNTMFRSS